MFYRVVVDGIGIYEKVDMDCPKQDSRRKIKLDGSWLVKAGPKFSGAVSAWTEKGMRKYKQSGLFAWHKSVVKGKIKVLVIERPKEVLYEDDLQIIFDKKFLKHRKSTNSRKLLLRF